jgi:uncharacterized membrane protein
MGRFHAEEKRNFPVFLGVGGGVGGRTLGIVVVVVIVIVIVIVIQTPPKLLTVSVKKSGAI